MRYQKGYRCQCDRGYDMHSPAELCTRFLVNIKDARNAVQRLGVGTLERGPMGMQRHLTAADVERVRVELIRTGKLHPSRDALDEPPVRDEVR